MAALLEGYEGYSGYMQIDFDVEGDIEDALEQMCIDICGLHGEYGVGKYKIIEVAWDAVDDDDGNPVEP